MTWGYRFQTLFSISINTSQFSGSHQQIISQFVSITRIKLRYNAGVVLQQQSWDLDKAIAWFNEHKNDIDISLFKL